MSNNIEALIASEIADFFSGFGSPGEPETPQDMQEQLLARLQTIFAEARPLCVKMPDKYDSTKFSNKSTVAWYDGYSAALDDSAEAIRAAGGSVEGD